MYSNWLKLCSVVAASVAFAANTLAQDLQVGSPAPALPSGVWMNGKPVAKYEKGQVYVIEFWATWCDPCVKAMPGMSELSEHFKGKATFIGVNVLDRKDKSGAKEDGKAHDQRIAEWVKKNAKTLRYRILLDDDKDSMVVNWMIASDPTSISIPKVFIVGKDGKVAWIGHPEEMKAALYEAIGAKSPPR